MLKCARIHARAHIHTHTDNVHLLQVPIPVWNDVDDDTEMFVPDTLEHLIYWKDGAGGVKFEYIEDYL